ncbi:Glutamate receptor isoform 1 [Hibiscus syriacus]|uniref:Glutamate receptor isoform 1 n=1 Tax=Hibiscus syriacus TaxID=106335 RepID=A0A6A2WHB5_HIBSY|nr:septum-promoting GTP-binding protein 1-like [Hibiscus syriacus]KAE8657391.1 Glutamate receptor isoform 1 [Hibiscus syriacus]
MTQIAPKMAKNNFRLRVQRRVLLLQRCFCCFWDRLLMCSPGNPIGYRMLSHATNPADDISTASTNLTTTPPSPVCHSSGHQDHKDSDLVPLKISLLGDPQIGKTSFLAKYIGDEKDEQEDNQEKGLNLMDKTFVVEGARIYYSIWEVDGAEKSQNHIPLACQDSAAILFMFDLTSRCTLNNVISWYQEARKWNQTAIPILIGAKFDDFIQLPIDLQWTIASQARAYAKALNATLFFSSAAYNINVNKIFKFITAKLFDLPWKVERNLTIGEPIIDF